VLIDGTPTSSTTGAGLKLLNGGACTVSSNPCTGTYTLASGLADKQHTVEIYKRTEALYGYVQFQGFSNVSGGSGDWALVPTVDPYPRRIEFIGDSITAGYGVLGPNANCQDDGDYNDAYESFSGDTAHSLGASFVGIAYSGKGAYVDYNGNTTASDPSNPEMPAQWLRTWENNPTSSYAFATQVDVVVINLGTNDFSYQNKDPGAPFVTAYQNLVGSVRSKYPNAYILMLVGPIVTRYNPFDGAAAQLKSDLDSIVTHFGNLGDHNMADLNVGEEPDCESEPTSCGCSDHPNVAEDTSVAAAVVANIKAAKGW
jgi:lysophospholipase L1-like esterase